MNSRSCMSNLFRRAVLSASLLASFSALACYDYSPKVCQPYEDSCGRPLPCNCEIDTECSTRGDCTSIVSQGALYADGSTTTDSCTYYESLRIFCVWIYTGSAETCSQSDGNCAPASCGG